MWTIILGFHIEPTSAAIARAERAQSIPIPAATGRRRDRLVHLAVPGPGRV